MKIEIGCLSLGKTEKKYVKKVLDTNRLSYGPFSKRFERDFADAHNCKYAIMSNSGTSSLQVALAALKEYYGWGDGDEVIVPGITFVATSNVVLMENLVPVFVDVDPRTYNIDYKKIQEAINYKTRCVIPAHLFGQPCDMDPILNIARSNKLAILEDSCETMFVKYKGRMVGSFGDISCFSTYVAHLLVTGVGGISCTSNPDLALIMRSLINHGRDGIYLNIDDDDGKEGKELEEIVSKRFRFVRMGYSYRATEMEAAIGVAQMEKRTEMLRKRKENAEYLSNGLKNLKDDIRTPYCIPGAEHAYMMYPIVTLREGKEGIVNHLESNGIETRDMLPLINQPFYVEKFGDLSAKCPNAAFINTCGFFIGCHQGLTQEELDYIIEIIHKYFAV